MAILVAMVPLLTISGQTNLYESGKRAFDGGDYAAAAGHFGVDIRNVKLTGDTISIAFADELNLMASALYRQGKADEAVGYGLRALHLYEALFGQASEDYAMQCVNLATYYYDMGEYGESISYENFAIRSYDRQGVNYFAEKGQERLTVMYEEAAAAGIDVRMGFNPHIQMSEVFDTDIQRQWSSGTDLSYVRQCRARVDRLYDSGDSTSLNYFHAVDSLAMAYIAVREAPRAASWVEYWGARKNELCGDRSVETMRTYYIYALAAFHSNDIPEAEDRASTVINVLDELTERDDDTYLNALMLRCSCYLHMGILGSVRTEMPRLLSFAESAFGRDSRQYDAARFLCAQCQYRLDNGAANDEVLDRMRECVSWRTKNYGAGHPDAVNALLALAHFLTHDADASRRAAHLAEAEQLYSRFYELQVDNVKTNFLGMTIDEQKNYWDYFSHYYLELIPQCAIDRVKAGQTAQAPSAVTYNAALFGKGILLNSEVLMRRALTEMHDAANTQLYNEIQTARQQLLQQLALPASQRSVSVDGLRSTIERKQKTLAARISAFGSYTDELAVDWKAVQRRLRQTDAAVEFVNVKRNRQEYTYVEQQGQMYQVPSGTYTEDQYAAVVITKNCSAPTLLPLFDLNGIGQLIVNGNLRDSYLSERLWKPIIELVGAGVTDIWFSPAGVLHSMPVESLHDWIGQGYVADRVRLHRLSTTRSLAVQARDSGKGGTIYGGLFYDASLDDTAAAAAQQASTVRGAGGGLPYLEGTEIEADQLYNMMRANMQSGASVSLLKGAEGTETSFKALAGRGNRILHIGTHGFYSPAQQRAAEDRDLSMIRSGLYMAGADYGMQADDAAAGADDGVLTAEEIAAVDLRGLDMVSLSACETALGDISGEGVFGLQRGFKKAGAGSILMSLWKVDDEATCLLMTEFYKHWLSEGCTKYAALELAKRAVRSHTDRGWDNPRYWAAFILLDGID